MKVIPNEEVRRSYLEQAQLSQAHRWLAACLTEPSAAQLSELLADAPGLVINDVEQGSDTTGLPRFSNLKIEKLTPSVDSSAVRIHCAYGLQSGAAESGTVDLHFSAVQADFPLITSVVINGAGTEPVAESAPAAIMRSRILALKHRWHGLVENPTKRAEPFREIVTEDFSMDWGRGSLSTFEALAEWVQSTSSIAAARHDIAGFDCSVAGEDEYTARFEFAWSGISLEGEPMQAESEHRWLVREEPGARFPQIARMEVNLRVPFHIVTE